MTVRGRGVPVVLVLLVLLAGCAGDSGTAPPTSTQPPSTTERSSTPTTSIPPPTTTETTTARGPSTGMEWNVTVTEVVDGDTLKARFPTGETDTLRLLGVDTPETTYSSVSPGEFEGIPASTAGRDHLYEWGQKATEMATNTLSGEQIRIAVDDQADRRGSFGRLLVYVSVDGQSFNLRLLEDGYARFYDSEFAKRQAYSSAEDTARTLNVGLWEFTQQTTTEAPQTTESSDVPPPPPDGDYDCSDFSTQAQANHVLHSSPGDPHRLDSDGDSQACESLP